MDEEKDKIVEIGFSPVGGISIKLRKIKSEMVSSQSEIITSPLKYYGWCLLASFADKYTAKQAERKLEGKAKQIPPKFIKEILNGASFEENESLQDLWINLLLNWQDPHKKTDMRMVYIEIIKSLSPTEAKILEVIHNAKDARELEENTDMPIFGKTIREVLDLSYEEYELAMLNLFRTKCCEGFRDKNTSISIDGNQIMSDGGIEFFRVTKLGYKLIENCIDD